MSVSKSPLYHVIYSDLLKQIEAGVFSEGDKLPTEKELAAKYNVSRITCKRSFDILTENGYIYRIPGKGTFVKNLVNTKDSEQTELSRVIGVVMEGFSESYGTYIISGIEQACAKHGLCFILKQSRGSQLQEKKIIDELLSIDVNGLIIMPVHDNNYNPTILKLVVDKFPIVLLDRELKGIPASYVGTDNYKAAKDLTDYLFDLGHERICFVTPPTMDTSTVLDRKNGFLQSNVEHGIFANGNLYITQIKSTLPNKSPDDQIEHDVEVIKEYILNNPDITAFFAVEYNIALLVYKAIEELGKKVPDDFSIVCFDMPENYVKKYLFTHVCQNEFQIGLKSIELLLDVMNGDINVVKEQVDSVILLGESTKNIK